MRSEGPEETEARRITADHLKVPVERLDWGQASSLPDGLILRDGREDPFEVVSDHDSNFNKQWDALAKIDHHIANTGLGNDWIVHLADGASVRRIRVGIVPALAQIPETTSDLIWDWNLPLAIRALRVEAVSRVPIKTGGGTVIFMAAGGGGVGGADVAGRWVSKVLEGQPDVARKLGAYGGIERHAFVWATMNSEFAMHLQLDGRAEPAVLAPTLPPEITHVWVSGGIRERNTLYWSPDKGWVHIPFLSP